MYDFSFEYSIIDKSDILNIRKYLKTKNTIKLFSSIKKTFIGLLTDLVNESNNTKCVLLSNRKCKTGPALNDLHHNK